MNKQRGLSLTGMIAVSFIVVLLAILSFKVIPVYLEYQTIQRLFKSMAEDPALRKASKRDLESAWAARTSIDNVKSLPTENIEFTRDANGVTITAEYAVKVPLFRNVSLYFEFRPTSQQ
jgi:hypothetical protein